MPAYTTEDSAEFVRSLLDGLTELDEEERDLCGLPEIESVENAGEAGWLGCDDTALVRLADGRSFLVSAQEVER